MFNVEANGGKAILLMLPKDFCEHVISWGKDNISDGKLSGLPNKGREGSPHITLTTGIIDESPERAFKLLGKQEAFKVKLGVIDCFRKPDKGYDVLKISVDVCPTLSSLNNGILQNLEVDNPILPYVPHITLAYIKPSSCEDMIGDDTFKGLEIPINSYLYSDRELGGRVVPFKQKGPLKDSLDYGYTLQEVSKYLGDKKTSLISMSSRDMGRVMISMINGNKIA